MLSTFRSIRVALPRMSCRSLSTKKTRKDTLNDVLSVSNSMLTGKKEYLQNVYPSPEENPAPQPNQLVEQPPEVSSPQTPLAKAPPQFLNIPPAEDPLLHLFTSILMFHGKREKASNLTSRVLLHLHGFTRAPPLPLFREAIMRAAPAVRVLRQRQGPKVLIKPTPLSEKQRMSQAIRWIWETTEVKSRSKPSGQTMPERVAREMIKILNGSSAVLKKKEEIHKLATTNRSSIRFR